MEDFSLYEEIVLAAHEQKDSDTEPYIEEYEPSTSPVGMVFYSPFCNRSDSYTTYC